MTFIPGTGSTEPQQLKGQGKADPEKLNVINIEELKKPVVKEDKEFTKDQEIWYNQLKYWILFGLALSAIFVILALINWRFLFLTPLGPYIAYLSWHLRKWFKKNSKKFDSLA